MRPPAVIGIGNEYRGDDAAGLCVVRALRGSGLAGAWELLEHSGEGAGLIDAWESRPRVVLIDAMSAPGLAAGTVQRHVDIDALSADTGLRCSSHAFGVGGALALAALLGRLPTTLVVYAIAGVEFGQGARMSAGVAAAVGTVAKAIREEECRHDA